MNFSIIVKNPIKYDMPYSAGMYGKKNKETKRKKSRTEKICENIVKAMRV